MDSLFHGSPLLLKSDESLRDPEEVVLNVASELNMEDTLLTRTPLSCSDVSIHCKTSKYTDSNRGIERTPEGHHLEDEHSKASQICPSGVLLCWILVTFAAIVVVVLSSDYGRHFQSEHTLHDALMVSTHKEEIILNKDSQTTSDVHSSTAHPFLKRNATVKNSKIEKLRTGEVENTSATGRYTTEERDWSVDSPIEIVPLIETDLFEEEEEFIIEEFYFDELVTPQVSDKSTPLLHSLITPTHASAPTMTFNDEVKGDMAIPLPLEEDFEVFDDVSPSFSNEDDWIRSDEELLDGAESSFIADDASQGQLFNNSEDPTGLTVLLHPRPEPSSQMHDKDAQNTTTTNEDLILEHHTLHFINELEMEAEVPGPSEEYAQSVHSTPYDFIDGQSNTSSALVTKALENEETITRTQTSGTLIHQERKPSNRITISVVLCAAIILLVALYLRRKAMHSSVDRNALNSFSHDSSERPSTTPSAQRLSSSTTLEAHVVVEAIPVEAETKRITSRNAKPFHALGVQSRKRFEFLNRKTHKRKIQPSPHTPAIFQIDSLPPELWAVRLQPSETTP